MFINNNSKLAVEKNKRSASMNWTFISGPFFLRNMLICGLMRIIKPNQSDDSS